MVIIANGVRDEISKSDDSISLLHPSSLATLNRLAEKKVGLIILDECHHLLGHWGRVMADALRLLNHPMVIGLTATPPDRQGKDERDLERYDQFFGDVDFSVPVPAVVKDGFLAPYQDLAYFVRPTNKELKFIASADGQLNELVEQVCEPDFLTRATHVSETGQPDAEMQLPPHDQPGSITDWLRVTLTELRLPTGHVKDWNSFARRDPAFALAARQFLGRLQIDFPPGVPPLAVNERYQNTPAMEYLVPVLDRFVRHFLRRSPVDQHRMIGDQITRCLRTSGVQITETGTRPCVSPVGRVLAYSKSKTAALLPIIETEMESLGEQIRAVVIADFERSSSVSAQLNELMDDETGGAIAAFKALVENKVTDSLEPVLLTGSTILIDDEIEDQFLAESRNWLAGRELNVTLESKCFGHFRQIVGGGSDWVPRVYVELVTELFQRGVTRCLVGTRGLLGEGWDANKINVLVDLTTVTTSMSINQLRGRSFRLDPDWQEKLANNWDVVCIAPEFNKGFDDYDRFKRKHKNLYGVTDDGAIEKGVGHVHPAFTEIKPEGLESSVSVLNSEMIHRSRHRDHVRQLWKIGEPFQGEAIRAVETKLPGLGGGFPPFSGAKDPWSEATLTAAIARAVIASLTELGKLTPQLSSQTGVLSGGYVRTFLNGATPDDNERFATAMKQVLGPLDRPRYIIPREVAERVDTWVSKLLPEVVGKYFQQTRFRLAMMHAVPDACAKNKSEVAVFQKHWNQFVSPGEAVFALRGEGEEMLDDAKNTQSYEPQDEPIVHEKDIFV